MGECTARNGQLPAGQELNRRGFLKLGGAALAGVTLLGPAGCGPGGERARGVTSVIPGDFYDRAVDSWFRNLTTDRFTDG